MQVGINMGSHRRERARERRDCPARARALRYFDKSSCCTCARPRGFRFDASVQTHTYIQLTAYVGSRNVGVRGRVERRKRGKKCAGVEPRVNRGQLSSGSSPSGRRGLEEWEREREREGERTSKWGRGDGARWKMQLLSLLPSASPPALSPHTLYLPLPFSPCLTLSHSSTGVHAAASNNVMYGHRARTLFH